MFTLLRIVHPPEITHRETMAGLDNPACLLPLRHHSPSSPNQKRLSCVVSSRRRNAKKRTVPSSETRSRYRIGGLGSVRKSRLPCGGSAVGRMVVVRPVGQFSGGGQSRAHHNRGNQGEPRWPIATELVSLLALTRRGR
jgi:hypothetical protein